MALETIDEKTPTANAILIDCGELTALAAELDNRAIERLSIKPACPMAQSVANFANKTAAHLHKTDTQICKDHTAINKIAETQATILRCVKWILGLIVAAIGSGGLYQVWQWIVVGIKHLPLLVLAVAISGCHVRAYPPLDANGQPTAMPVVVLSEANPPGDPMAWWEMLLAVGGGLLGVQTLGMGGRGGIAVAQKLAGTLARKVSRKT